MTFRRILFPLLICTLGAATLYAKDRSPYGQGRALTPGQAALVQQAIAREKVTIEQIRQRTPVVETYIQDIRPDAKVYEAPVADDYILSRVAFNKAFVTDAYVRKSESANGFLNGSRDALMKVTRALGLGGSKYSPAGFMDMMFVDPSGFDRQHYAFSFVRREFLGSVRTNVFEVHPIAKGLGRFYGRIWVEDQGGNIVRFNGTYVRGQSGASFKYFYHVDSWRANIQPDLWLPAAVYVEEPHRTDSDKSPGLKAQTRFWGYALKTPPSAGENVSVHVDDAVDQSSDSQDVSPLEASRMWVGQAENNVIDRLIAAGLVAPPTPGGYEEKVLEQIVVNLSVPNNLAFPQPIHVRVLLTGTVESTTVGNTILISKGLLDSLPSEEAIASVVAMELAHIAEGHHIDTRYAFNDRLLFPDTVTFQRIALSHTSDDDAAAAKQAVAYLENSMYKDKLGNAGLYYEQLAGSAKILKGLTTPTIGDSLLKPDGTPWMADLAHQAPKLDANDATQVAALPLGSWLKTDPWNDSVAMVNAKRYAPMYAAEKMPFEVTPVYYRLQRYAPPLENAANPTATEPASASVAGVPAPAPASAPNQIGQNQDNQPPAAATAPNQAPQPASGNARTDSAPSTQAAPDQQTAPGTQNGSGAQPSADSQPAPGAQTAPDTQEQTSTSNPPPNMQ